VTSYADFLAAKSQLGENHGFFVESLPSFLYDFQVALVEWALRKGRAAIFADCGLGKSPMQLAWADEVVRRTNKPVLIATPLAVAFQLLREAEKFGIEAERVVDGQIGKRARIVVTNYERVERFEASDFAGMVCDESSILKNFDGARRAIVTEFLRTLPYRLLCTATAAPNDYVELGTSSEALGELGHMDMLARFFKKDDTLHQWMGGAGRRFAAGGGECWRFKGHAEQHFWRWVCSWARAVRKPSDLGFDDARFVLPPLVENEHIIQASTKPEGMLFNLPAVGLREERDERRRTIVERCEKIAAMVDHADQALVWCHLNDEGDRLAKLIPGAEQVSGKDDDDDKEAKLGAFARGELRVLVTKPKIGAWGLNLQRCAHVVTFVSHSYEQYYQGVRRCWRFGQTRPVTVDIVGTDGERRVIENLRRKAAAADRMFGSLVAHMNDAMHLSRSEDFTVKEQIPPWALA
jgi:hypothetical protein